MSNIDIYTDGGSRGNPGQAAIGVYILSNEGKILLRHGEKIGIATNNVAEYKAVIFAIEWIIKNINNPENNLCFNLDSSLVVNQLNGIFKIKDAGLKLLVIKIKNLEKEIKNKIIYRYIPREENKVADFLVNSVF